DTLQQKESLELLASLVPGIVEHTRKEIHELIHLAGGLPLALQVIGQHLQTQMYSGQPRRWYTALAHLREAETRLRLSMPRAPLEQPAGLPAEMPFSLHSVIELSYQRLDTGTRQALALLASLPNATSGFSEAAALASGVSLEALDNLLDSGLLE